MKSPSRRSFLTAASAFSTIGLVSAPAVAAQFNFKSAGDLSSDHPTMVRLTEMWKAVERESGGRLRVQHFPNSVLGGDAAMLTQLREGALQFFLISPGIISQVVPVADICNLGFAFKDATEGARTMDGPVGDYVRREIAAKGMYPLPTISVGGMREITSSRGPIRTADDLAGFKIRVLASKITVDLFKTLGANPTPLSFNEIYTALQTKLVEGQENPLAVIQTSRFYEVQKYLSFTNEVFGCMFLLANVDQWKSLPPDLQAIVLRNNRKYGLLERRDIDTMNDSFADKLVREGMIANKADPSSFRARLGPYYKDWANAFGPTLWGLLQNSISGKLG